MTHTSASHRTTATHRTAATHRTVAAARSGVTPSNNLFWSVWEVPNLNDDTTAYWNGREAIYGKAVPVCIYTAGASMLSGDLPGNLAHATAMGQPSYSGAYATGTTFNTTRANACYARGSIPMTWCVPYGDNTMWRVNCTWCKNAAVLAGYYDAQIQTHLDSIINWGKPVIMRMLQESNGRWYAWGDASGNVNGNAAGSSKLVQQYLWDFTLSRCSALGKPRNITWTWAPSYANPSSGSTWLTGNYPGDSYIDWAGVQYYPEYVSSAGYTPTASYFWKQYNYDVITGLTDKPIFISEYGIDTTVSPSQGTSIVDFGNYLLANCPQVHGWAYYQTQGDSWASDGQTGWHNIITSSSRFLTGGSYNWPTWTPNGNTTDLIIHAP